VLARVRISVPDRPGSLGLVTSAVGRVAANIDQVHVLETEGGRALDDVFVSVRDRVHLQSLCDELHAVTGVRVIGVQSPAPPATGYAELQLLAQVLDQPDRALQTLLDGAPGALGADWGALVDYGGDGGTGVLVAGTDAWPGAAAVRLTAPLRLSTPRVTGPEDRVYGGTALVPLGQHPTGLLLVRDQGPEFHRTELWRLEQLGRVVGRAVP